MGDASRFFVFFVAIVAVVARRDDFGCDGSSVFDHACREFVRDISLEYYDGIKNDSVLC